MTQPPPSHPTPPYPQQAAGQPGWAAPPGQPGWAAPPGQPGWAPQPPPAAGSQGTNGFAIASLIFGLIGGVLLNVIFGIVALRQIPRRGQSGKGLAIAGLVLSGLWVVLLAAGVALALIADGGRDPSGQVTSERNVRAESLKVGDCLNDLKESKDIRTLPAVPCAQPHEGEVFADFKITGDKWPGEQAVTQQAEKGCVDLIAGYAPKAAEDKTLEIFFLHPTSQSWAQGDRTITCVATDSTKKRVGSLRG